MTGSKTTLLILVGFILCVATRARSESVDLTPELAPAPGESIDLTPELAPAPAPEGAHDIWIPEPFKKFFVRIINEVGLHKLDVTCKSKNDVLVRTLPPGNHFEFGFRVNFPGSTLFHCDLRYLNHHAGFVAFKTDLDFLPHCSGVHCIWQARQDGIYLMDSDQVYQKRLGWDGKTTAV
uniref:uncharacterized protein LOC105350517 n=1 Tax=Fragaria vesca subsp. vesca TaxID=101020 RepID=UPI0005C8CE93|nr:PREDICTED: uncharacterized protein LOC105350517 [Fragaria vesca subsp. vesca]